MDDIKENISPTAIISPGAIIGRNVEIGPYSLINDNVSIGDNTKIGAHVIISGQTVIGKNNQIYHGAIIGETPQDLKYAGEDSLLIIGDNNVIREYATIHKGTQFGGGETIIQHRNLIMSHVHIAHDVIIGNNNILAQNAVIGGHVIINDFVIVGGLVGVHQFVRIGSHAFIGSSSKVNKDILPFSLVDGNPCRMHGLNITGLTRRKFTSEEQVLIKRTFRKLHKLNFDLDQFAQEFNQEPYLNNVYVNQLIEFIQASTNRGFYNRNCKIS